MVWKMNKLSLVIGTEKQSTFLRALLSSLVIYFYFCILPFLFSYYVLMSSGVTYFYLPYKKKQSLSNVRHPIMIFFYAANQKKE